VTTSTPPVPAAGSWYLYLVRTAAGSLYTGISTDPSRRLAEHAGSPRGARALRGRGPLQLVWQQPVGSRSIAQRAEALVKRLPRARKEALLTGALPLEQILPDISGTAATQDAGASGAMAVPANCGDAERSGTP
jgi:putative endonuclease